MWFFLLLLALVLIEIGLFVVLGGILGLWLTLAWVIFAGFLGIILVKGVSMMGPVSMSRDLYEFRDAASTMGHRVLVVVAGVLLILPGFFSDVIGLLLMLAPVRRLVIRLIGRRFETPRPVPSVTVIDGEWHEADIGRGVNPTQQPGSRKD